jgi:antitoxin YefM
VLDVSARRKGAAAWNSAKEPAWAMRTPIRCRRLRVGPCTASWRRLAPGLASQLYLTIIQVMTMMIPLADAKARLSAVLDDVRDTHDRVVITRNGRPEAVIISVADLETMEETLDLLSTPGAIDEIRTAEAEIARGEAIGADELRRLMAERIRNERNAG